MKEIIKNSVILCLITLISGLLLGVVYEVTKEPRAKQQEKAKEEAYFTVFKEADSYKVVDFDKEEMEKYLKENGFSKDVAVIDEIVEVFKATDSSGIGLGYVITVTDKEGYGGEIKMTIGITGDGIVNGISFLTLTETAGVGMKAAEAKFKNQFAGKEAQIFEYTSNTEGLDNHIDAISGATVTTKAVTNGVNAGVLAYEFISGEGEKDIEENSEEIVEESAEATSEIVDDDLEEGKGGEADE